MKIVNSRYEVYAALAIGMKTLAVFLAIWMHEAFELALEYIAFGAQVEDDEISKIEFAGALFPWFVALALIGFIIGLYSAFKVRKKWFFWGLMLVSLCWLNFAPAGTVLGGISILVLLVKSQSFFEKEVTVAQN